MKKVLLATAVLFIATAAHAVPVDIPIVDLICKAPEGAPIGYDGDEKGRTGYLTVDPKASTVTWSYSPDKPGKVYPLRTMYLSRGELSNVIFGEKGQYAIFLVKEGQSFMNSRIVPYPEQDELSLGKSGWIHNCTTKWHSTDPQSLYTTPLPPNAPWKNQ